MFTFVSMVDMRSNQEYNHILQCSTLAPKGISVPAYQKTCNIKTPQITQMVVFVCKRHFEAALYHRPIYHSTIDLVHNWAKIKIVGCCQDLKVTLSGPPYLSFPV